MKTGKRIGGESNWFRDVEAGEKIVIEGAADLADGQPVTLEHEMHTPGCRLEPRPLVSGLRGPDARTFIDSKLTPLIIITSVLLGAAAIVLLPREEEPQIKVPMIDVLVAMPGFSAKEVEERATRPMEKLLWEIPGVEYIYSTSRPGESLAIVRFKVGEDVEKQPRQAQPEAAGRISTASRTESPSPLIKPKSIDDVPILALTFHSARYDHLTLRRLVAQVDDAVKQVPLVAETTLIGGARRQVRVLLDPARLASRNLSRGGDRSDAATGEPPVRRRRADQQQSGDRSSRPAGFLPDARRTSAMWSSACSAASRSICGRSPRSWTGQKSRAVCLLRQWRERSSVKPADRTEPAVTLEHRQTARRQRDLRRRRGPDARWTRSRAGSFPNDVQVSVTRHYGETAAEKSNELLSTWALPWSGVSLLILLTLGWRESAIVAIAIPSTLALTLLVFYLYGFTLNRITLFALIFTIGILVDDAIVVVENIVRHFHLPQNKGRSWRTSPSKP